MKKTLLIVLGIIVAFAALAQDMESNLVQQLNFDWKTPIVIQDDNQSTIEGTDFSLVDKRIKALEEKNETLSAMINKK